MCGIFAYLNFACPQTRARVCEILLNGLRRLEYRGYDSSGLAVNSPEGKALIFREIGRVQALADLVDADLEDPEGLLDNHLGIAHTRWATHGEPNPINAHPQRSDVADHDFVLVHNGIITNYKPLKTVLQNHGFEFESETDTEVVAKLLKHTYDEAPDDGKPTFVALVMAVIKELEGAFAIVVKSRHYPGEAVAFKRGSPLILALKLESDDDVTDTIEVLHGPHSKRQGASVVATSEGRGQTSLSVHVGLEALPESLADESPKEFFFASDASAVVEHTKRVVFLEDEDVVVISNGGYSIHHKRSAGGLAPDTPSTRAINTIDLELDEIMKGSYKHFMLKEIFEQPESVVNTMRGRVFFDRHEVHLGGVEEYKMDILRSRRILFLACGTSFHSGLAVQTLMEELVGCPVVVENASDFLDRRAPIYRDDTCVFISQSGETADVLRTLFYCKERGALCVGITNTVGSAIARATDCGVHVNAGAEIGVASTKAYTSQIIALILVALVLSEDSKRLADRRNAIINDLKRLPDLVSEVLELDDQIRAYADEYVDAKSMLVIGRGYHHATCREGALKIKEITYMHAEGILSGELKHGTLALVDETMPIIVIAPQDSLYSEVQNAVHQISARKGNPLVLCTQGDELTDQYRTFELPATTDVIQTILTVIPLQLIAYYIADNKGFDVDHPRNLAKSVTTA